MSKPVLYSAIDVRSLVKILFVQSTKTNSPMIVTDTNIHCIVCADILEATSYETTFKNSYYTKLKIAEINTRQIQYPLKMLKLVAANNTHLKVIEGCMEGFHYVLDFWYHELFLYRTND